MKEQIVSCMACTLSRNKLKNLDPNREKMVDQATRQTLSSIPLLRTKAGPRDKDAWVTRLKEEYQALIKVGISSI